MKVMLVDEEGAVRLRVRDALVEPGGIELVLCQPDFAPRHDGVYARVMDERPDVVILDVSLPSGGALGLIERIKALSASPVVIAICADSSLAYRSLCHRAGAEYFFDFVREQEGLTRAMVELKRDLRC